LVLQGPLTPAPAANSAPQEISADGAPDKNKSAKKDKKSAALVLGKGSSLVKATIEAAAAAAGAAGDSNGPESQAAGMCFCLFYGFEWVKCCLV
jgi:hypothetical protein